MEREINSIDGISPEEDNTENGIQENDSIITEEIEDIDEQTEQEILDQEKEIKENSEKVWNENKEEHFSRLLELLKKSKFYIQFLKNKMDEHLKIEKLKEESSNTKVTEENEKVGKFPRKSSREKKKRKIYSEDSDDSNIEVSNKKRKANPEAKENNSSSLIEDKFTRKFNGESVSDRQPKLFTGGIMRDYQLDGFEWLKVLYQNGVNGILADEMGLGKTAQCIALLCHLMEMKVPGPYLVCAPLSTLPNWLSEFKRFAPKIPIVLYHGSIDERHSLRSKISISRNPEELKSLPVVITSYDIIIKDRKHLQRFKWKYIIIDEGHRIKNYKCCLIRELKHYRSANRLLLTGTPLQNNLAELWSLLNFLLPEIFDNLKLFESWFDLSSLEENGFDEKIVAEEREKHVLSMLHEILSPFLLRRIKTDVELFIPPKRELLVYAPLCPLQESYYRSTVDKTILKLLGGTKSFEEPVLFVEGDETAKALRSKFKSKSDSCPQNEAQLSIKMQNIMMQLRKCCNHPYLVSYPLIKGTEMFRIDEDLVKNCGKMLVLDTMLPRLIGEGHKVLIFSQMTKMLDILEDYCHLRKLSFSRLDGTFKLEDRIEEIKRFNEDPKVCVFLISTRAGGLGLNLTAADTVIIYDSDWNPQCDLQAMDRCHRIGQTRTVMVYRFITMNTIDQKIMERAAGKRKLEKMIIHKDKFKAGLKEKAVSTIDPEELIKLLKARDHDSVFKTYESGKVFTDEQLEALMFRGPSDKFQQYKEDGKKIFEEVNLEEKTYSL